MSKKKKTKKKKRSQQPVPSVGDTSRWPVPPNKRIKTARKKKKSSRVMSTSDHTISASRLFATISPARHCSSDLLRKEVETSSHPESPQVDVAREHIEDGMEVEGELDPVDERSSDRNVSLRSHKQATFTPKDSLFPFYTSVDTPSGISLLAGSNKDHSHCIMGYVPPPPSEAELAAVMQELDSRRSVSPVDILTLIDSWEREKQLMEVSAGVESKNNKNSHVNCPKKSPQSDVSLSVRKTPKVSVATNIVKITATFRVDSAACVETGLAVNRRRTASKTSMKVDRQCQLDDSDDDLSITERQPESKDVNDEVIARKKQDCGVESVHEDRSRNDNDVLNETNTSDSDLRRGRPAEDQMHRFVGFNTGKILSGKKRNIHSESHSGMQPATPVKFPASPTASEHDVDTCWDTNMDTSLDTSHLSFTQALASVVSPSPVGKIRMSSANRKSRARNLFKSPKGKMGGIMKVSSGHGYEEPVVKGVRETEVGVESVGKGFGKFSTGGVVNGVGGLHKSPAGRVGDLPASDVITRPTEACETPLKNTEMTPPRQDTVSPTLFDSGDDDIDTVADGCNKAQVNITSKTTTSADDPDMPNFSLLGDDDQCEHTETCAESADADVVETTASATVLDLPNFDLLDDDSFDELDFDLGFDLAESDEEVAPVDGSGCHDNDADIPRTDGGATGVSPQCHHSVTTVSPQCHHAAVSSGRISRSPTELVTNAVKPLTNSPVIFKSDSHHYEVPRVIVRPTFVSGSLATTSHPSLGNTATLDSPHYDLPDRRTQRDESVFRPSEMTTRHGLDDTVSLNRSCVKTAGSRLHLNLKQNHNVQFNENSDPGRAIKQPLCKGREAEQPSPGMLLHEERFRGKTMEQPGTTGKMKKETGAGLGGSFSEGSLGANKVIKSHRIRASNSTTHGRHIDAVREVDELWRSSKMDASDDFVQPQFGTSRVCFSLIIFILWETGCYAE